jgi:hypothetical protein
MILVEPGALGRSEQAGQDQPAVERRQRQRLETQERLGRIRQFGGLHQQQVLQPNAVMVRQIIAGLVGQDHAGRDWRRPRQARQADRPLMHRQIAADAMAGAVVVVEPDLPQRSSGKGIQMRTADTLREHERGDGDMTLQHAGHAFAQGVGRLGGAGPDRTGDVGGAVGELRP